MRGGWVGSDVWDKVPNKYGFFLTPSLILFVDQVPNVPELIN